MQEGYKSFIAIVRFLENQEGLNPLHVADFSADLSQAMEEFSQNN